MFDVTSPAHAVSYTNKEIAYGQQKMLTDVCIFSKMLEQNNEATSKLITLILYFFNITKEAKDDLRESIYSYQLKIIFHHFHSFPGRCPLRHIHWIFISH